MKKKFDCVEFQHQAGREIMERLRGMTIEEKAAYWKSRSDAMRKEDEARAAKPKRKTA